MPLAIALHGAVIWKHAPGYLIANVLVWLLAGSARCSCTSGRVAVTAGSPRAWTTFLSSHSVTSARKAIEEIDEFAAAVNAYMWRRYWPPTS
jgi:ferric-dicitrate binding protein FerR (iron transport regulator)